LEGWKDGRIEERKVRVMESKGRWKDERMEELTDGRWKNWKN
jgi:hypothetical protein